MYANYNPIEYPTIIYGTSYLGNLYQELTKDEKLNLMAKWFNVSEGKVMIDSAGKYGAGIALEFIGWGLKELNIKPEDIIISNKLGWYRVPLESKEPTFESGIWVNLKNDAVQKISYNGILQCWEQGCELLGANFKPQLVSVHDPDEYLAAATDNDNREVRLKDILGAYKALFELKDKGEVKAVGIGSKDWLVIKELYHKVKFDWVMLANSFTLYNHPKEIVEFMEELANDGVSIINSAIFNAGFITGGNYFNYRQVNKSNPMDYSLLEWRNTFFSICEKYKVEPAEACLQFALSAPQICGVALNTSKPKRMIQNIKTLSKKIPDDFWKTLKQYSIIAPEYKYL